MQTLLRSISVFFPFVFTLLYNYIMLICAVNAMVATNIFTNCGNASDEQLIEVKPELR